MVEILTGLLSLGFNIITFFFNLGLALVVALIMTSKGRNGLLWGFATFFFPWIFFVTFFIPRKVPKFKSYLKDEPAFVGRNPVVASIMGLAAIVAKSDGQVSTEEIRIIKQYVTSNFRMNNEEFNTYEAAFNYGKSHPEDYEEFARVIRTFQNRRESLLSICYLLMTIAMHDENMAPSEEVVLKQILGALGLSEYEYLSIKRYFTGGARQQQNQNQWQHQQSAYGNAYNQQSMVGKYAKVLGVSEQADMTEIKKAYRKLAKEHHPDRLASEGMPEDYMTYANQRISEINEAYEYLKKVKTA